MTGPCRLFFLGAALLLLLQTAVPALADSSAPFYRDVEVEVTAPWNTTEIWAEAHAFFDSVSPSHAWAFVDHLADAACPASSSAAAPAPLSDARQYALASAASTALLGAHTARLLPYALNFSLHSPRVEAARETAVTALQRWVGVGVSTAAATAGPVVRGAFAAVLDCPALVAVGRRLHCADSAEAAAALPAAVAAAAADLAALLPASAVAAASKDEGSSVPTAAAVARVFAALPSEVLLAPVVSFDSPYAPPTDRKTGYSSGWTNVEATVSLPVVLFADAASDPCAVARAHKTLKALADSTAAAPAAVPAPAGPSEGVNVRGVGYTVSYVFRSRTPMELVPVAGHQKQPSGSETETDAVTPLTFPGLCRDRLRNPHSASEVTVGGIGSTSSAAATVGCLRYTTRGNAGTLAGVTAQTVLGFGAELALKSTEYTVIDKSAADAAAAAAAATATDADSDARVTAHASAKAQGEREDGAAALGRGHTQLRALLFIALAGDAATVSADEVGQWSHSLGEVLKVRMIKT